MTHITEEWKPVVGFEETYAVSSHGRVMRRDRGRFLRATQTDRGYCIVNLSDQARGKRKCCHVYNLVTAAFLGPKPRGLCVNHIDGDKTNNRLANLEYVTHKENNWHAVRTGLKKRALTAEQVLHVRAFEGRVGAVCAAKLLGISKGTVNSIWEGRYYADIW